MNVVWVEIPVKEIERATQFYGMLFNQQLTYMEYEGRKFATIQVMDGQVGLSINQFAGFEPRSNGVLIYLNAGEQFDEMLVKITQNGGKVVISRSPMSESSVFATFNDTEGNTLALYADI
jgi:uncharacterized protein